MKDLVEKVLASKTATALSNFAASGGRRNPEMIVYKSMLGASSELTVRGNVETPSRTSERGGGGSEVKSMKSLSRGVEDDDGFSDDDRSFQDKKTKNRGTSKQYCVKEVATWLRGKGHNIDKRLGKCDGCERMHINAFKEHPPQVIWNAIKNVGLLDQLGVLGSMKAGLMAIGNN